MKKLSSLFIALTLVIGVVLGLSPIRASATSESEPPNANKIIWDAILNSESKSKSKSDIQNPVISISSLPDNDIRGIEIMCDDVNAAIHDKDIWDAKSASKHKFKAGTDAEAQDFLIYHIENENDKDKDTLINIEVNMVEYRKLKEKDKQTVMQQAISIITSKETNISRMNKNKIFNNLCDLDVSTSSFVRQLSDDVTADFNEAYSRYFKPWSGELGIALGVISLGMFISLAMMILIDLAYIVLPFFQMLFTDLGYKKNRPMFVSIEAVNAVKEAESKAGQGYTNPVGVYFRSKLKQLIAISLCLVYLVSGEIYNLIGAIMDYFSIAIG